ncbi:MAG: tetratricopeptide repeat protein [Symploca sp. SIO1B1]|nr:tetratricopeptide repeat protein [Symploca sp. SIO1B1]
MRWWRLGLTTLSVLIVEAGILVKSSLPLIPSVAIAQTTRDTQLERAKALEQQAEQLQRAGKFTEAISLLEEVLEIRRRFFDENHYSVSSARRNVISLYQSQGRYEEVEQIYLYVLKILRDKYDENHSSVSSARRNVISLYQSQGRYEEVEQIYLYVLKILRDKYDENHSSVSSARRNVISLYQSQGRYEEVEQIYLYVLKKLRDKYDENHSSVSSARRNVISLYQSQGRYEEVEQIYLYVLKKLRDKYDENHSSVSSARRNVISLYQSQGRYEEVEQIYLYVLKKLRDKYDENHSSVSSARRNVISLYQSQGRYEEVEQIYLDTLYRLRKTLEDDDFRISSVKNDLAQIYRIQGKNDKAEQVLTLELEKLIDRFGLGSDKVAQILNNLLILYDSQGRYDEAETLLKEWLQQAENKLGDSHPTTVYFINALALLSESQGQYEEAEQYLLTIQRLSDSDPDKIEYLANLAILYLKQGKYKKAENTFNSVIEQSKATFGEDHPDTIQSLNNLANLYIKQDKLQEAEDILRTVLEKTNKLEDERWGYQSSINGYSSSKELTNRDDDVSEERIVLESFGKSNRELGEKYENLVTCLNSFASLYKLQKKDQEAEELYLEVLSILGKTVGNKHHRMIESLNNLASLYQSQNKYQQAEELHIQAEKIIRKELGEHHPQLANSLNNLALLYLAQNQEALAIQNLQEALEIEEENLERDLTKVSGEYEQTTYARKLWSSGYNTISFHLNFFPENQDAADLALETILRRKGRVLDATAKRFDLLRSSLPNHLKEKFNDWQSKRTQLSNLHHRNALEGQKSENHLQEIEALKREITDLENELARQSSQFRKFNRLRNSLGGDQKKQFDNLNSKKSQLANLYKRGFTARGTSAGYLQEVQSLENEITRLEEQLVSQSEQFRQESQSISIENIQQLLTNDTSLIEIVRYFPYDSEQEPQLEPRYAVYILNKEGNPIGIDLGVTKDIDVLVEEHWTNLRSRQTSQEQIKTLARKLDAKIMAPVRQHLGKSKHLLIAPDSILNLIPFETLVEKNKYLIEDYRFTYLTSGGDLLRLQNTFPNKQNPLILGDPYTKKNPSLVAIDPSRTGTVNVREYDFIPIPEAAEEARFIAGKLDVEAIIGDKASEEIVKQVNSPEILHIASHGWFTDAPQEKLDQSEPFQNPMFSSALVLAGAQLEEKNRQEDGFLTAYEIASLDLSGTKLVVLSACDTGIGGLSAGDGIYGLRRALVLASAESQVISLWRVSDKGTKKLMEKYYTHLLDHKEGRSESLRKAQLEMLKNEDTSHPYYWGAFINSGNWKPLDID